MLNNIKNNNNKKTQMIRGYNCYECFYYGWRMSIWHVGNAVQVVISVSKLAF